MLTSVDKMLNHVNNDGEKFRAVGGRLSKWWPISKQFTVALQHDRTGDGEIDRCG